MKKLPTVGLLVAASLFLCVPASWADFSAEVGVDTGGNINASVAGSGDGYSYSGSTGSGGNTTNGAPASEGSRTASEYRATMNASQGPGDAGGQAATGGGANTTDKTLINTDQQYKHLETEGQLVTSPRDKSSTSQQQLNQGMLLDEGLDTGTDLLSVFSVNPKSVPSGSFDLGFPSPKPAMLWGKTSGWAPSIPAPHCSTSSCDFNVVDP